MNLNIRLAPFVLFIGLASKVSILGGSYQDAAILLVIGLFASALEYKASDKKLKELSDKLAKQEILLQENHELVNETRDRINSLKIGQQLKVTR